MSSSVQPGEGDDIPAVCTSVLTRLNAEHDIPISQHSGDRVHWKSTNELTVFGGDFVTYFLPKVPFREAPHQDGCCRIRKQATCLSGTSPGWISF